MLGQPWSNSIEVAAEILEFKPIRPKSGLHSADLGRSRPIFWPTEVRRTLAPILDNDIDLHLGKLCDFLGTHLNQLHGQLLMRVNASTVHLGGGSALAAIAGRQWARSLAVRPDLANIAVS